MEDDDDEFEQKPQYCVTFRTGTPYQDRDNYICTHWSDAETLKDDTVDGLYEQMARVRVQHSIRADEDPDARNTWAGVTWADRYEVEFSEITLEVCRYDEDKLKATETWKKLGEAREAHRAQKKIEAERERKRSEEWNKQERERKDREEYVRLTKKFGGAQG